MAATNEAGTNNFPVIGIDATVATVSPSTTQNWLIQSASVDPDAKRVEIADGLGVTKARSWFDELQQRTLTMEVIITGTSGSGASAANTILAVGVKYVVTSTANPAFAGNWTLDKAVPSVNNTGAQSYSLTFKPTIS
jgi:hypothetical protein